MQPSHIRGDAIPAEENLGTARAALSSPLKTRRLILAPGLCQVPSGLPHECRRLLKVGRISWNDNVGSAGRSNGRHVWDLKNTRTDVDSKCRDSSNHLPLLKILVNPPYLRRPDPLVNELGLEQKNYYMTCDVCKVLKITPDTFRQRIYRGYYPEYQKIGVKRIYTPDQIKELIRITENLIREGVLSIGASD